MSSRNIVLAFAAAGILSSVVVAAVVLSNRRSHPPAAALAGDAPTEHSTPVQSESAVAEKDLAALMAVPPEPPRARERGAKEGQTDERPAASAKHATPQDLDAAVQWLRGALSERYGKLTAAEAAALTDLDLRGASITDEDLRRLAAFPALNSLNLQGTAITDAGIANLRALRDLKSLDLRGTKVSGLALSDIPSWNIEALHLTETRVTGADLIRLPPMPRLNKLKLNSLAVDDAALEVLAGYPTLRHLELDRTQITDAGLRKLLEHNPSLARIELRGTPVTQATLQELRTAYPGCELVFDESTVPGPLGGNQ